MYDGSTILRPEQEDAASDEDLLAQLAGDDGRGGERALAVLYRRFAGTVFRMAARSLDEAAATDVVQDVFVGAWRSAATFDPASGSARAWLLQAASNRIANELRRRRRRPGDGAIDVDTLAHDGDDPAEDALAANRRAVVRRAFAALPPAQQQALSLAFFDDLTQQQVATALGLPLGTAKTRIRTALQSMRRSLAPIAAALLVLLVLTTLFLTRTRTRLSLDEQALSLVTASDAANFRLGAVEGTPAETHARYRARNGTALAVVTLSRFPATADGAPYVVRLRHGARWLTLGTIAPDEAGNARAIFAQPELATLPDEVVIETADGRTVVAWREREAAADP